MMNMTETVKQLLIINVLFFIGSNFVPNTVELLALNYVENDHFGFWQIVSSMFMHGSIMHILFNMYALITFGSILEQMWGSKKFLFFYFSCGIIGSVLYVGYNYFEFYNAISPLIFGGLSKTEILTALNTGNLTSFNGIIDQDQYNLISNIYFGKSLGASGAIYGLLVAFAFALPNAELNLMFIPIPIKAKYFVPAIILFFDIIYGIILKGDTGVGHAAHIGGALAGFVMMWYWKKNQFNNNRWN